MSKIASESPPPKKLRVEGQEAPNTTTATMDVEPAEADLSQRWSSLATIMGRPTNMGGEKGPLKLPGVEEFECDPELHEMVAGAKILCVGAGGLGCELLKVRARDHPSNRGAPGRARTRRSRREEASPVRSTAWSRAHSTRHTPPAALLPASR